ncbi:cobyric acid synthase [Halorubrum lipolyticum]|uniref:Probable cobyric acid synthase n=1 Tax=Halorubrum lipolyticum DSM 21995 TaxID=1227482 RepID=M0NU77_9EURY|nr:cobyric acid synthase [Halorubrum lipolyticum]EMA61118.1 cobyric acid synthase [Halorubrum lipolyticum DSM 21995]
MSETGDTGETADIGETADTVLIAGTASHAGKSTLAAGLCRLLARRGVSVAPFKAQNMSNNARVALAPDGEWGEIGVSQHVQARAAGVPATTDMNPVLLKPRGDGESQLVIDGEAVDHFAAGEYYADHWEAARDAAVAAHRRLAADHDVVVAEGAGSIAEINLHDRDLANVECARFADAAILIAVDIERGGAFASLYGTLELLPDDVRERVAGAVITKFRGDPSLLEPGIAEIEERTGVPVVGVVPHDDPGLPAEDSLSLPDTGDAGDGGGEGVGGAATLGADDGVPEESAVRIAVPRLPRISNFTDLEPLAREPGVRVAYVPLDSSLDDPLADADAVVLPGSKNTVDDLLALREAGLDEAIRRFEGPIVGICGGYQILGERITGAEIEGTGSQSTVEGVGVLPVETHFSPDKRVERVTRRVEGVGPLAGATGTAAGYEIHMGRSSPTGETARPLGPESAATDRALGTYLHGLFENEAVRDAFAATVFAAADASRPAGRPRSVEGADDGRSPYDRAADLVADHVDLAVVGLDDLG